MGRMGLLAAVLPALVACTSTRMLQREGCWVKQTEKWPGRVSEELGFCTKPAPVWAQTSASSGSRRPLTSLTIDAPAAIAARATDGL